MEKELINELISGGVAMALGLFAWLAKAIFARIERDLAGIGKEMAKLEGKLDSLQSEIRANTISVTKASSELAAVWRTIDGGYRRNSDRHRTNDDDQI